MFSRIPQNVNLVVLVVAGLLTGWWAWSYTGVYRLLAELQLRTLGSYGDASTFLFTLLPTFLVMLLPLLLVFGVGSPGERAAPLPPTAQQRSVAFMLVGAACVLGGVWTVWSMRGLDAPVVFDLADVGVKPPPTWVRFEGAVPDPDGAVSMKEGASEKTYVPLVTPGELERGEGPPYRVFAEGRIGSGGLQGLLTHDGLPGLIRTEYERAEVIASEHWVLDVGATPSSRRSLGWVATGLGLVMGLGGAVFYVFRRE